jgi:hypothetical protein
LFEHVLPNLEILADLADWIILIHTIHLWSLRDLPVFVEIWWHRVFGTFGRFLGRECSCVWESNHDYFEEILCSISRRLANRDILLYI